MIRFKHWIRTYFGFSRTETNGFVVLLPLTLLLIIATPVYRYFAFSLYKTDFSKESATLDSLLADWNGDSLVIHKPVAPPFSFNPNTAEKEDFVKLGLSEEIADRILHYRSKGGRFRIKSDFQKIYGLTNAWYERLFPFILLPDSIQAQRIAVSTRPIKARKFPPKPDVIPFDLNTADTLQLKEIRGIGPVLSRRIIRYRELLGGFVKKKQLNEVYGLDSTVERRLRKLVFIQDVYTPRQLNVNKASAGELARHPYIDRNIAEALVNYRFQHGPFQSIEGIRKLVLIDDTLAARIEPYLTTEER